MSRFPFRGPTNASTAVRAIALAGLVLLAACGGSPSPTATPVPSPALSAFPPDTPLDLPLADRLYREGSFEQAMDIYSAVVQQGSDDQRKRALWSLARAQSEQGQGAAAVQNLGVFLSNGPPADDRRASLLKLGTLQAAQGDGANAERTLQSYIDTGGAAWPYVRLRLAELAARRGDGAEAIRQAEQALAAADLPAAVQAQGRLAVAGYRGGGDAAAAAALYEQVVKDGPTDDERADALWRLADLRRRAGDPAASGEALSRLTIDYPGSDQALSALGQPELAAAPVVSGRERALVLFRHRLNDRAAAAFQALAGGSGREAAEAHYYLGILGERAGDTERALSEYNAALNLLPPGLDDALRAQTFWDEATVLESLGRLDEAIQSYASVAGTSAVSDRAAEGMFRAGFLEYQQGRQAEATGRWVRYLELAANNDDRARAHFWMAKAYAAAGDPAASGQQMAAAASAAPLGYYGLRGSAVTAGEGTLPAPATEPIAEQPDWDGVEAALRAWAGPEDGVTRDALLASQGWLRAVQLAQAGLKSEADAEFMALAASADGGPWPLYRIARAAGEQERYSVSARVGALLLDGPPGPPPEVLTLAYPLAYKDIAGKAAAENAFSPLLLLSLVRQESLYDAGAVSPAQALGLTQVIPGTAAEIAGQLGQSDFHNSDLFRPSLSLRFGAHYLASQLQTFDGALPAALAAYNAGAGNSARWWHSAGGDPDVFLETIDFSETRLYVENVLENYARYLYAYGAIVVPSLPL